MKCPNCDFEIRGIVCEACGAETPHGSLYCYKCGAEIQLEEEGSFDLDSRILCSDETCTGVINEEGVCGVCGKPHEGKPS
jgi:hypothetical protein